MGGERNILMNSKELKILFKWLNINNHKRIFELLWNSEEFLYQKHFMKSREDFTIIKEFMKQKKKNKIKLIFLKVTPTDLYTNLLKDLKILK